MVRLNSFSAIGAGQKPNVNVDLDYTYYGLMLECSIGGAKATVAQMKAQIPAITLTLNGIVQRVQSATDILTDNALYGQPVSDGQIFIWFAKPWSRSVQGEDVFAWGTEDIGSFNVKVSLDGAATIDDLQLSGIVDTNNSPIGLIEKIKEFSFNFPAVGKFIFEPEETTQDAYNGLTIYSGTITDVHVKLDKRDRLESNVDLLNEVYKSYGLVPQAGVTHILFDATRKSSDSLPLVGDKKGKRVKLKNFEVALTNTVAETTRILTRTVGRPD